MGTITVGELRQNPTQMLRDVRRGAVYTITDRGEPVAEVHPVKQHRWVSGDEVAARLAEIGGIEPDPELWAEIDALRDAEPLRDPWERYGAGGS